MSDPAKPQFIQPALVRKTRLGHGVPLPEVAPVRKTKVGVAPPPKRRPPAVPPQAKAQRVVAKASAAPFLLQRRKEDDAFAARVTDKLPDARLIPAAARAAFAGTWGVTLQGPDAPRAVETAVVAEAPRGLLARVAAMLRRAWGALRRG